MHCCPYLARVFSERPFIHLIFCDFSSPLRFSSAALAFENCDEKYRAVFAGNKNRFFLLFKSQNNGRMKIAVFFPEPKPFRGSTSSQESNSFDERERTQPTSMNPQPLMGSTSDFTNNNSNDCILHVICSPMVS